MLLTILNNFKKHIFVYKLYKGGGECSRKGLVFKTGGVRNSATAQDYYKSGYDQGHLVNFEDYAYDCVKSINFSQFIIFCNSSV